MYKIEKLKMDILDYWESEITKHKETIRCISSRMETFRLNSDEDDDLKEILISYHKDVICMKEETIKRLRHSIYNFNICEVEQY